MFQIGPLLNTGFVMILRLIRKLLGGQYSRSPLRSTYAWNTGSGVRSPDSRPLSARVSETTAVTPPPQLLHNKLHSRPPTRTRWPNVTWKGRRGEGREHDGARKEGGHRKKCDILQLQRKESGRN